MYGEESHHLGGHFFCPRMINVHIFGYLAGFLVKWPVCIFHGELLGIMSPSPGWCQYTNVTI